MLARDCGSDGSRGDRPWAKCHRFGFLVVDCDVCVQCLRHRQSANTYISAMSYTKDDEGRRSCQCGCCQYGSPLSGTVGDSGHDNLSGLFGRIWAAGDSLLGGDSAHHPLSGDFESLNSSESITRMPRNVEYPIARVTAMNSCLLQPNQALPSWGSVPRLRQRLRSSSESFSMMSCRIARGPQRQNPIA